MKLKNILLFSTLPLFLCGLPICVNHADKLPVVVHADGQQEFLDGDGTEESPFLISSKNHLLNISNHLNAHFSLVSNIKILDSDYESGGIFYNGSTSKFLPIGSEENPFTGTFDGNSFSIDNLKISENSSTTHYVGFFGNAKQATIKNLNFTNYVLSGSNSSYIGGVLGYGLSTKITNCHVKSGTFSFYGNGASPYSGVICGFMKSSNIIDCSSKVSVTQQYYGQEGGIAGRIEGSNITNCVNESDFTWPSGSSFDSGGRITGGICGYALSSSTITSCVNKGLLYFKESPSGSQAFNSIIKGTNANGGIVGVLSSSTVSKCANLRAFDKCPYAGGIVGCSLGSSKIKYCSNTVDIDGSCQETFTYLGGIVAMSVGSTTISYCYNTGNVTASVNGTSGNSMGFSTGGICAYAYTSITINDCYNTGKVCCYYYYNNKNYEQSSGILGFARSGTSSSKPSIKISNCFSIGELGTEGAEYTKRAIIGSPAEGTNIYVTYTVSNCFYDSSKANYSYSSQTSGGVSYDAFKNKSTFTGFDFASIWCFDYFTDYEYPTLQYFDTNSIEEVEIVGTLEFQILENYELDLSSYSLSIKNQNGVFKSISFEQEYLQGYNKNKIGVQTVYAQYRGVKSSNYLTVTVVQKSITSISINTKPTKLQYLINEDELDLSGGKINVHYNNETTDVVDMSQCDVSGFDNSIFGEQTIILTYQGFQTSFVINIYKISSITVSTLPSKTTYVLGQTTDFSTGKLQINYTNGTNKKITLENSFCSFNTSLTGTVPVLVEYGGFQCEFNITITERIIDYYELVQPEKLVYYLGEELDLTGGYLRIVFESTDNYTEYVDLEASMITGFDTTTAGIKTLTVKYGEIEDSFVISVKSVYTVTFVDYDGTVISTGTYHYGDTISVPSNPSRPSDNTYNYTFTGWDKDVSSTCTGNVTYTAQYSSEYIEYTVTFLDESGNVISTGTYHYGDQINIPNPTKDADDTYTYAFSGWDKDVSETCTGNATYTASFSSTYIEYTVTFVDYDGTVISTGTYHYGDTISVPSNPSRPSDNTYNYTFTGWDKDVSSTCTGNVTYTAQYSSEYTEEYQSALLRDQLISEIDSITNVNLSTYSKIVDFQSRMSGLTDSDRAMVEAKLNSLIEQYNAFVNGINSEFAVSEKVFDSLFLGVAAAVSGLMLGLAFIIKRRFPL